MNFILLFNRFFLLEYLLDLTFIFLTNFKSSNPNENKKVQNKKLDAYIKQYFRKAKVFYESHKNLTKSLSSVDLSFTK
jgi:hypothetical protein